MFKHILVPTDFTDRSTQALEIAVKMAIHGGSTVTLMHVIEMISDADFQELDDFYMKLRRRAQKKMERMIGVHETAEVPVSLEITYGKRIYSIVNYALENAVDLIILASHRLDTGEAVQGWGTISYKVGILSHCPVMLVK